MILQRCDHEPPHDSVWRCSSYTTQWEVQMTNDEAHAYLLALENAQPPDQRSAANLGEAIRAIRAHAIVDFKSMIHEGVMAELLEIRAGTQILSDAYFADGQETRMSGAINRIDAAADHIVDQIRLR